MPEKKEAVTIDISTKAIVKLLIILIILAFFYVVRDIMLIVFISIVFAAAVDPWIDKLERFKIPRAVGILTIYLVVLAIFVICIGLLVPPIIEQIKSISEAFPEYYDKLISAFTVVQEYSQKYGVENSVKDSLESLTGTLTQLTSGIFSASSKIFGGFISLFGVLVLTFYMTIEESGMKKFFRAIAPSKYQPYIMQKANQIQAKMGLWLRGQLILSLVIFLITFIGLAILRVEYALVFALIAGVTEFIPYVGPFIGAVPAVLITLGHDPLKAIGVIILYIVIQQLENQILVPKVMQKTVGLNPIVVIIVMLIGAKIAGVVGLLLAVPATTIVKIFVADFVQEQKKKSNQLEA